MYVVKSITLKLGILGLVRNSIFTFCFNFAILKAKFNVIDCLCK